MKRLLLPLVIISTVFFVGCGRSTSIKPVKKGPTNINPDSQEPVSIPKDDSVPVDIADSDPLTQVESSNSSSPPVVLPTRKWNLVVSTRDLFNDTALKDTKVTRLLLKNDGKDVSLNLADGLKYTNDNGLVTFLIEGPETGGDDMEVCVSKFGYVIPFCQTKSLGGGQASASFDFKLGRFLAGSDLRSPLGEDSATIFFGNSIQIFAGIINPVPDNQYEVSFEYTRGGVPVDASPVTATFVSTLRYNFSFAASGQYRVRFLIKDKVTGFSTSNTFDVSVTYHPQSCKAVLTANPAAVTGSYTIDPDGEVGSLAPISAYCDMETSGGGWTLVMNYLHLGNTNPLLKTRSTDLPLLSNNGFGTDESNTNYWGHATPSMLSKINFGETRWFCKTSAHNRVIHFKTSHEGTKNYLTTGKGSMEGIASSHTVLSKSMISASSTTSADGSLPSGSTHYNTNQNDIAMTDFPFYSWGNATWGVRGLGTRWECDDFPNGDDHHTQHQVWVR